MDQEDRHRADAVWRRAERFKKLTDRVIGIGPFGIGLDGLVSFIPVVNTAFSVIAGVWIMLQAVQAKADLITLAKMGAFIAVDSVMTEIPLAGYAADLIFPGHLLAANALQKDIVRRHGVPFVVEDLVDVTPSRV